MVLKGFVFLFTFQFLHKLYDWTNSSPIAAIVSGVDESCMEHWKMGFYVYLLILFVETKLFASQIERKQDFIYAGLFSALILPWIIFITWYSIQSFAGPFAYKWQESMYAISFTYMALIICHTINKELLQIHFSKSVKILIVILLCIFIFELIWFTFEKPWTDVFSIPQTDYI